MTRFQRLCQIARLLDWTAVYADYKSKKCGLYSYHAMYFRDYCISVGITDCLLSANCVAKHLKVIEAQLKSAAEKEQDAAEPSADGAPKNHESANEQRDPVDADKNQVTVFDLEKLMTAAIPATSPTKASSVSSVATSRPYSGGGEIPSELQQINIEWSGMRFSYPCPDPGRNLALLLYRLRKLEEAGHAY